MYWAQMVSMVKKKDFSERSDIGWSFGVYKFEVSQFLTFSFMTGRFSVSQMSRRNQGTGWGVIIDISYNYYITYYILIYIISKDSS